MSRLESTTDDTNFAWDAKSIGGEEKFTTQFSSTSQNHLNSIINSLKDSELGDFDLDSLVLDSFISEIKNIKSKFLENGPGFVIINSFVEKNTDSLDGIKNALLYVSALLGTPIQQNATGLMVKEVRDRSLSYTDDTTSRYSDNKHGGNYHTDGAEIPPPIPEYLPLLCIRPAKSGGAFKLISSYTVHNKLFEDKPEVLDRLYEDFLWDRRGDLGPNGEEVFAKPIFNYIDGKLTLAYLRRYIEDGYARVNKQMSEDELNALDSLDSIIYDSDNIFERTLEPGQLMISVNSRTIHGRDSYKDPRDSDGMIIPEKQRLLLRTWVLGDL